MRNIVITMSIPNAALMFCAALVVLPFNADAWWSSERRICCDEYGLGCYSNRAPFTNANNQVPHCPRNNNRVEFYLYTRTNPTTRQLLDISTSSISGSNFDGSKDTKFLIHGYYDSGDAYWINGIVEAFLAEEDLNVIAVDWQEGSGLGAMYFQAVANSRVVGDLVGLMITEMVNCCGLRPSAVHLIGHSLGAHISGYAGTLVSSKGHGKVGKITGLDPAGPRYESFPAIVTLDPTDATLVEAIHTDGDSFFRTASFGARRAFGHLDFYPNGGGLQAGCAENGMWYLANAFSGKVFSQIICDHSRAHKLYLESMRSSCQFKAYPCASREDFFAGRCTSCGSGCAYMGYRSPASQPHGTFYMETSGEPPYCLE